jgi:hypothetical protein
LTARSKAFAAVVNTVYGLPALFRRILLPACLARWLLDLISKGVKYHSHFAVECLGSAQFDNLILNQG